MNSILGSTLAERPVMKIVSIALILISLSYSISNAKTECSAENLKFIAKNVSALYKRALWESARLTSVVGDKANEKNIKEAYFKQMKANSAQLSGKLRNALDALIKLEKEHPECDYSEADL
jgi:hypothetical protein